MSENRNTFKRLVNYTAVAVLGLSMLGCEPSDFSSQKVRYFLDTNGDGKYELRGSRRRTINEKTGERKEGFERPLVCTDIKKGTRENIMERYKDDSDTDEIIFLTPVEK